MNQQQLTVHEGVPTFAFARDETQGKNIMATIANGEVVPHNLYMVTMTYRPKRGTMHAKTHIAYVLAPSQAAAISQVDQIPMDTESYILEGQKAIESGEMTASAVRIPMHIRGWGLETF